MNHTKLSETLRGSLQTLFDCSSTGRGAVRVRTPFMYPDGDIVDVFVESGIHGYCVTDYGEALGWLQLQGFSDALTSDQRNLIGDVCTTLGVGFDAGELNVKSSDETFLSDAVHRVGQASVRVCDLWFNTSGPDVADVAGEIGQWLHDKKFEFSRNVCHNGRSGREWTVDYQVKTDLRTSLVVLLSTGAHSWARRLSERVVAECTDLSHLTENDARTVFVTLFNDATGVWRDEDFALVGSVSRIAAWSRPDEFEYILRSG